MYLKAKRSVIIVNIRRWQTEAVEQNLKILLECVSVGV